MELFWTYIVIAMLAPAWGIILGPIVEERTTEQQMKIWMLATLFVLPWSAIGLLMIYI